MGESQQDVEIRRAKRRIGYIIGGGVAALALAAGGTVWALNSGDSEAEGTVTSKPHVGTIKEFKHVTGAKKAGDPITLDADEKQGLSMLGVEKVKGLKNKHGKFLVAKAESEDHGRKVMSLFTGMGEGIHGVNVDGELLVFTEHKKEAKWVQGQMVTDYYKKPSSKHEDEWKSGEGSESPDESGEESDEAKTKAQREKDPEDSETVPQVELKAGSTFTWDDGLKVKLEKGVVKVGDGDIASDVDKGDKYMSYQFRVENTSDKTVDLVARVDASYNRGGTEKDAADLFGEDGDNSHLEGKIRPGQSRTGSYAFDMRPSAKKVVLEAVFTDNSGVTEHEVEFHGK